MRNETKIKNLLVAYQSLNDQLVEFNDHLFDINIYDIDGYWNDEDWSDANLDALKKRVSAIRTMVKAYKKLDYATTLYA